ncbi:hypothetical protein [Moorella stamsii]|nr:MULTISPECIES: hypothetical protein [Moorella]
MGLLALIALIAWFIIFTPEQEVTHVAETYLHALASGDIEGAKAVSTGRAAEAAGKLEGKNLAAWIDEISTSVQALGHGWARVKATVELTLADGTVDVGWYELEFVREGGIWKVYSLKETAPRIEGYHMDRPGKGDMREAEAVLKGYLEDLAAGRYREAARWLAGPALRKHLASAEVLGKGRIIEQIRDLVLMPLGSGDKVMLAEAGYRMGEKDVQVIVTFYRTALGWRIVVIS